MPDLSRLDDTVKDTVAMLPGWRREWGKNFKTWAIVL